ncbi:hypothetical protein AMATHDRAFT_1318 [Amanita thiersii Skay4041]|uniref:FAD/NAD(P)-binding domain-containing protein n=1 Tax=Amanita thiersii Skay4041 TaxID=703135 RepID=A0A2A9NZ59_9AGAR|nr:hypothetical protein AMATHDRAFT_1318 [Amanita thiersii Skay4041]
MSQVILKPVTTAALLTLTLYPFLKWIFIRARKKLTAEQIGLRDLELLGKPRTNGPKLSGTVVICGGSLAGLTAARVCHDHFENVIIVEPEAWLSTQGAWFQTTNMKMVFQEQLLRVDQQITGSVVDFEYDPDDPHRLARVVVRQETETLSIPATLVIDCTGPFCVGQKLLPRLGFGTDKTTDEEAFDKLRTCYDQKMHYSTLQLPIYDDLFQQLPKGTHHNGPNLFSFPDSRYDRKIIFSQIADRNIGMRWQWGPASLPTTLDEFAEFGQSLKYDEPIPEWWYQYLTLLKGVEGAETIKLVRVPPSVYTPFHKAVNMPSNWVALGDSIMRVNPVFGQGINKALLGIASLNTLLHDIHVQDKDTVNLPPDFSQQFFNIQAKKIELMWDGVKGVDYDYDTTTPVAEETLSSQSLIRRYIQAVQRLASHDDEAATTTWHVLMFLAPPIDYFRPTLIIKLLWTLLTKWHI